MKTIEEMKAAVIAYCEEVCPNPKDAYILPDEIVEVQRLRPSSDQPCEYLIFSGGRYLVTIHKDASERDILAAYRLLGLAERDAVAAERERLAPIVKYEKDIPEILAYIKGDQLHSDSLVADANTKIAELEARNAVLVEALEKIKDEYGYRYTYGDGFGNVTEKRLSSLGVAIDLLITANTEKGGGDE